MIRVAVIAPRERACGVGDLAGRLARALPAGCQPTLIDLPAEDHRRTWRQTIRAARDHDLVHVHYEYGLFHVVKPWRNRLARLLDGVRQPRVVTLHEPLPSLVPRWPRWRTASDAVRDLVYLPHFTGWESTQYRRAEHWIAHSRPVYESAARSVAASRRSLLALPVPASSEPWQGSLPDPPCIVTPGFIKRHKGYELLIEVLERLPGWRWVIAGGAQDDRDAEFLDELEQRIEAASLRDRVRITGYRAEAEIAAEISHATLAVAPFHRAAASASLAWAIACATPVVAADLPAFAEVAGNGAGIELIAGRDAGFWAESVSGLAADPERLRRLSQASRDYAERHSDAAVAMAHAEIYAELVGGADR